ncbi:MAG: CDP-alcohol phosphatidyltransferase family protein [Bacteroidaceae bacterium]|jgi:CDP-diacylglycerol--glycerol-3-phosphate 3-phosphatidyltransferase
MNYRDFLQQLIYRIINPLVRGMIRIGITPNVITTSGLVLNVLAAVILVCAGWEEGVAAYSLVGWAGGVVLFAGLFDMMDGRVARVGGMASTFGALYDSVLDRYSELVTLFGLCTYFCLQHYMPGFIITCLALMGSLMVSYVRARAEGLGLECKVGLMQRPERVVLTALGAILFGVFGAQCGSRETSFLFLTIPMGLIALLANLTAFARLRHCWKLLRDKK